MNAEFAVEEIASFVASATPTDMTPEVRALFKRNVLDSLGCAIGALNGEPLQAMRGQVQEYSSSQRCTLISGGRTSPDQAALFNSALVRYLDLSDSYMGVGELCHPSDNFGAILAAAEYEDRSGEDFLLALALAYEVQCRFTAVVPVMSLGFNHAIQLSLSVAAGASKLLGLDERQTANAVAIAGADNVSLAVIHAEPVSHWKNFSPGITGMRALYGTSLARRGITGPIGLFEGPNGLSKALGRSIDVDWSAKPLDSVAQTLLKKYCSLIHGQPVLETLLTLREEHSIEGGQVANVVADVFQSAYEFAGGGRFGDKRHPKTKDQADYNLHYLIAVALLDGEVGPAQLDNERVRRTDVQDLLQRVLIRPDARFTQRYPKEMPVRVSIVLQDGRQVQREQSDYEGSASRPFSWDRAVEKFYWLSEPFAETALRDEIVSAVERLDKIRVRDLTALLAKVAPRAKAAPRPARRGSSSGCSNGTWSAGE